MNPYKTIAKILRTESEVIFEMDRKMEEVIGKSDVLDRIVKENAQRMENFLGWLALDGKASAEEVSRRMFYKLKESERFLSKFLDNPNFNNPKSFAKLINTVKDITFHPRGFFLKKEIAKKFITNTPPHNILRYLGYQSARELVKKENIFEIFAVLRFAESPSWMNQEFLKNYEELTPLDFEEREIELITLDLKWRDLARDFVEKKYHNLSHLKEFGFAYIIPIKQEGQGELLRIFSLLCHYFYEISFYSKLFRLYAMTQEFGKELISLLRGDVLSQDEISDLKKKSEDKFIVPIIQRYLAKEDKNDSRILEPHINPEALHWEKAEDALSNLSRNLEGLNLHQWRGLDWVGDYLHSERNGELLVSFDLVDNIMSLIKEIELIKYLYHQQEALWNKIFKEYLGKDRMGELMIKEFNKGYIIFY